MVRPALGVAVHDHYGQTELGMVVATITTGLRATAAARVDGPPAAGLDGRVLREDRDERHRRRAGRVAIDLPAARCLVRRLRRRARRTAEKFTADGRWYLTGDAGRVDEDGYFFFMARDDDVIIMAGYRIGPFEVESVMVTHPQCRRPRSSPRPTS